MGIISFNTTGKDSLGWRLGNQMFQYASLLGIARKNDMTPYFNIENTYLNKCFKLGGVENKVLAEHHHQLFDGSPSFNSSFFQLPNQHNFDINGYLQTPKYFEHCKSEIKKDWVSFVNKLTNDFREKPYQYIQNLFITNPMKMGRYKTILLKKDDVFVK